MTLTMCRKLFATKFRHKLDNLVICIFWKRFLYHLTTWSIYQHCTTSIVPTPTELVPWLPSVSLGSFGCQHAAKHGPGWFSDTDTIIIIIIFHTVQDTFSVYCVPGSTPVPQNPMNAMVMVMVKLILNATSPECYISLPLTPSSSPLPPYVFPPPPPHPSPGMVTVPLVLLCVAGSSLVYAPFPSLYCQPINPTPSWLITKDPLQYLSHVCRK